MSLISGVMPGLGSSMSAKDTLNALKGNPASSKNYASGSHSGRSGAFTASGYPSGSMADQLYNFKENPNKPDQDVSFLTADNSSTYSSGGSGRSKKEEFDWLWADMAKHYDMSKETGYSEAMENTSYQRAVKDMKAAGLNPAVLFSKGADGEGSPSYIRSASSGGGGGGGGYSGRSYGSSYRWSKSQYGAFSGAGAVIGGLVGAVTSKSARGAAAGATAGAAIGSGIAKILNIF